MIRRGSSLLALSLLVLLLIAVAPGAHGAVLFVDEPGSAVANGGCTLRDAITSANTDAQVGNCQGVFSPGAADTIVLTTDVTLTIALGGGNGTPSVTSEITIEGSGFTVRRDNTFGCGTASDPEFRIFDVGNGGNLTLNDIRVDNGCVESANGRGGAIRVRSTGAGSAVLNLNRSIVSDSQTYGAASGDENNGGGLAVQGVSGSSSAAYISKSVFESNTTDGYGGAIDASIDPSIASSVVRIDKSTFARNEAGIFGGAINAEGNAFISNSTLAENKTVPSGGGNALHAHQTVFVGNITIKNSIIHNGAGPDCVDDDNSAIVSQGWNLASDGSCSLSHPTDLPSKTAAQVGLGPLVASNVPGGTHYPLKPNSLAIDNGDPNADVATGDPTDQIGQPRSGRPERGSIEFIEPNIVTTPKSALNLGRVRINKNGACKQVEVRNDGNADLDISAIAIVNDPPNWFRLCTPPTTPTTLAAGEHTFVYARCHPTTSAASRTGTLRISSNDPQTPNKDITVKCTLAP